MSTGNQPFAAPAPIGGAPTESFQLPSATANGGAPMPTQVGQRTGFPQLDFSQAQQSQQPQYQQPAFQQPAQQPQFAAANPWTMPQQPSPVQYAPAQQPQYQTPQRPAGDQLQLGGPFGGYSPAPVAPVQLPYGQQYQQPQQPQQLPATSIRDQMAARGLPVSNYQSDDQLIADYGRIAAENQQLKPYARLGYEQVANSRQNGQQPTPVAPVPGAQVPTKPQTPEWREEWSSQVQWDAAKGRFIGVDEFTSPLVVERANERKAWEQHRAKELISNPVEYLKSAGLKEELAALKDEAKREVLAEITSQQDHQRSRAVAENFIERNRHVLGVYDQSGREVIDPSTGKPALTQLGLLAMQTAEGFRNQFEQAYGVSPRPDHVIQVVEQQLGQFMAQQQRPAPQQVQQPQFQQPAPQQQAYGGAAYGGYPQAQPQFQQQPQYYPQVIQGGDPRENFVQQAIRNNSAQYHPNSNGTIASAVANEQIVQNPSASFSEMLRQGAVAKGLVHQGA